MYLIKKSKKGKEITFNKSKYKCLRINLKKKREFNKIYKFSTKHIKYKNA